MQVTVALGKQQEDLQLAAGTTLAELNDLLARRFGTAPHTTKLCVPGGKAALHPAQQGDVTLEQAGAWGAAPRRAAAPGAVAGCPVASLAAPHLCRLGPSTLPLLPAPCTPAAGIRPGARLKMMASRQADVAAVQAARDDRLTPGFDAELLREMARTGAAGPRQPPAGPHTFQRYEAWQRPGLAPPPGEALKLLHRRAAVWRH